MKIKLKVTPSKDSEFLDLFDSHDISYSKKGDIYHVGSSNNTKLLDKINKFKSLELGEVLTPLESEKVR